MVRIHILVPVCRAAQVGFDLATHSYLTLSDKYIQIRTSSHRIVAFAVAHRVETAVGLPVEISANLTLYTSVEVIISPIHPFPPSREVLPRIEHIILMQVAPNSGIDQSHYPATVIRLDLDKYLVRHQRLGNRVVCGPGIKQPVSVEFRRRSILPVATLHQLIIGRFLPRIGIFLSPATPFEGMPNEKRGVVGDRSTIRSASQRCAERLRDIKSITLYNVSRIAQLNGDGLRKLKNRIGNITIINNPAIFLIIDRIINISRMYRILSPRMRKCNREVLIATLIPVIIAPNTLAAIVDIETRRRRYILGMGKVETLLEPLCLARHIVRKQRQRILCIIEQRSLREKIIGIEPLRKGKLAIIRPLGIVQRHDSAAHISLPCRTVVRKWIVRLRIMNSGIDRNQIYSIPRR